MLLGTAKKDSPYLCAKCNGPTRWVLPLDLRNTVVAILSTIYVVASGLVMIFYAKSAETDLLMIGLFVLSWTVARKLYRAKLLCRSCAHLG